ncbi:MAG: translation elongation factor 4 [Planctomycetota bacterium]|nr:translation elongation factor 4 [Planctomycetota bacterium]MDI6787793.1 translation elongation factor 4 [Planctomycetota bacterium]
MQNIRNFCIIAHIDHGKSTLADRLLEVTGAVSPRELREQFLDNREIERERGITIKAKAVLLRYQNYLLNLIDTPGHVDFSYEVLRSLKACEGALLLVDATQGVQAQTVANALLARESNLKVIPVINKIDMPIANVELTKEEIQKVLEIPPDEIIEVSAKLGTNVDKVLSAIVSRIPPPSGDVNKPLKALIFDAVYDDYRGVIVFVRMIDGSVKIDDEIVMLRNNRNFKVEEVGIFTPKMVKVAKLSAGEVGYIISGIRNSREVKVGDTITLKGVSEMTLLPGYREPLPMVFAGFYPVQGRDFTALKKSIEKLSLNDSSFTFEPETSEALGMGFRCGFLGLLHMDIVKERLRREQEIEVVQTAPNVPYEVVVIERGMSKTLRIDNPAEFPDELTIREVREPIVKTSLIIPAENIGSIMTLCELKRGEYLKTEYLSPTRVILYYNLPLGEIIYDFYDKLKSATHGFGTMDYVFIGYKPADMVKLRIFVANTELDAFSSIVHHGVAESKGRRIIQLLRQNIPRHLFQIALQAAVGKRIVARENISALSKNVTGKCYGGDITRKRKLWAKQKEGKKKMKSIGSVEIPQSAFIAVLSGETGK